MHKVEKALKRINKVLIWYAERGIALPVEQSKDLIYEIAVAVGELQYLQDNNGLEEAMDKWELDKLNKKYGK